MGSLLSVIRHFTEIVSCEQQNTFHMQENYPCTYSYWNLLAERHSSILGYLLQKANPHI